MTAPRATIREKQQYVAIRVKLAMPLRQRFGSKSAQIRDKKARPDPDRQGKMRIRIRAVPKGLETKCQ